MKKYIPLIVLVAVLLVSAFLRLYRISDYMSFLGDEGRDVLIVKRMIVDHKFTLLGPTTSVGSMYLGPAYYYFMLPFLWLWGLDPVGPAVMVALFSLATIWLVWRTGKDFFDERVGLIAALLYGLSPLVITYSHSSWNPNVLPFWSLLMIYSILRVVVKKNFLWLGVAGFAFGIAIQLHYIAFVFLPILLAVLLTVRNKINFKYYLLGFGAFLVAFSPFIVFELRHQFINTQTVIQFVTRTGGARTFGSSAPFFHIWDLTVRLFWRLVVIKNAEVSMLFLIFVFASCVWLWRSWFKNKDKRNALTVLFIWYAIGIGFLALYTGSVFDYYLMFAFPLPFLLTGIAVSEFSKKWFGKLITVIAITVIVYFQISQTPILKPPNRLVVQTKQIADFILSKTNQEPYNFALITGMNSDHAYRYFLEVDGYPPTIIENPTIDPERKTVTKQLFIVCEQEKCEPLGHPLWEVAGFGQAEIEETWKVGLFEIYKLVPLTTYNVL